MSKLEVVAELAGLGFPEALRWRDDSLWFSDMFRGRVIRWKLGEPAQVVIDERTGGPEMPGGLGWLPDGTLLVVDCMQRRVLSWTDSAGVRTHADLAALTRHPLNDMFVDTDGTAWVGGYGFDPEKDEPVASPIFRIALDMKVEPTAARFVFPNGTERFGARIAVAETFADRVSYVNDSGEMIDQQDWLAGSGPDGLSFGPEGYLYVASAFTGSLDVLDTQGKLTNLVSLTGANSTATNGGPRGIFDCAVHPNGGLIAYSSAVLDEAYAQQHDTGMITLLRLGA